MAKISIINYSTVQALNKKIIRMGNNYSSLEEALQEITFAIYAEFRESIVLARTYVTVPYGQLPERHREFVNESITKNKSTHLLTDKTPVLSLFGSYGRQVAWNKPASSKGHLAIPFVSAKYIEEIPMIAALLKDLGIPLDWLNQPDPHILRKTFSKYTTMFYVPDARTALDQGGRKIITAQDFVNTHEVKTVLGSGGAHIFSGNLIAIIIFTNEIMEKREAELLMMLANVVASATAHLAAKLFTILPQ